MKLRNSLTKLITLTVAVTALVCVTGLLQPVKGQTGSGSATSESYTSLGIVPGQTVRLSVASDERSAGTMSWSFSYYLAPRNNSTYSAPLYQSEWIQVAPGEVRFADVRRNDLHAYGDHTTGRVQVIVKVTRVAPTGGSPDDCPCSLEVIPDEAQDGNSVPNDSKYRLVILPAKRPKQFTSISLIPGQSLRYTFYNQNDPSSQPVRVRAYIYDATGRLLTQTDPVELRPGQAHTVEIKRDDLRVASEEAMGRLQVRAGFQVAVMDGSLRNVNIPAWLELVDTATGTTQGGSYYTGTVTVSSDGF
ncbi:MAG TPA: hypothetical protein VGD61_16210 [Pyrinomonadaceae bacterium]